MSGNDDRDRSSFSKSIPPVGALSSGDNSGRREDSTTTVMKHITQPLDRQDSDKEEHRDGRSEDTDATLPPLGVKLTGYRLFFMTTVFSFGAAKSILAFKNQSTTSTALDWVSGTFLTLALYWIGLYEESNKWKWFFQVDLAPTIGHCAMRVVGEFISLLFIFNGYPIFASVLGSLLWLIPHVHACYLPHVHFGVVIAVMFSTFISLFLLYLQPRRLRVLDWGLSYSRDFADIYGPGAPGSEGSHAVGTIVRSLCGIALCLLPFSLYLVATSPNRC